MLFTEFTHAYDLRKRESLHVGTDALAEFERQNTGSSGIMRTSSLERSPVTGTCFPQLDCSLDSSAELSSFRNDFQHPLAPSTAKPFPRPITAVKFDHDVNTPTAIKDKYTPTSKKDFSLPTLDQCLSSKQTVQHIHCFTLETDRRLTNLTSSNVAEFSCKSLELQSRNYDYSVMNLSSPDFLSKRVTSGLDYCKPLCEIPTLQPRRRFEERGSDIYSILGKTY